MCGVDLCKFMCSDFAIRADHEEVVEPGSSIAEELVVSGGGDGDIAGSRVAASLNGAIADVSKDAIPASLLKIVGEDKAATDFVTVATEGCGGEQDAAGAGEGVQ